MKGSLIGRNVKYRPGKLSNKLVLKDINFIELNRDQKENKDIIDINKSDCNHIQQIIK